MNILKGEIKKKVVVNKNKPLLFILAVWLMSQVIALAYISTVAHNIAVPRYIATVIVPFSIFVIYFLYYVSHLLTGKFKQIFVLLVMFAIVSHAMIEFGYTYRMRAILGEQFHIVKESDIAAYNYENKTNYTSDEYLGLFDFNHAYETISKRVLYEQYDFFNTPLLFFGMREYYQQNKSFFLVDVAGYDNLDETWKELKEDKWKHWGVTKIAEIKVCGKSLFCKLHTRTRENKTSATVYSVKYSKA